MPGTKAVYVRPISYASISVNYLVPIGLVLDGLRSGLCAYNTLMANGLGSAPVQTDAKAAVADGADPCGTGSNRTLTSDDNPGSCMVTPYSPCAASMVRFA